MARQLMQALETAGHDITLVSRLRSFSHTPDAGALDRLLALAHDERSRLLARYRTDETPPDLWFTYHPYYKAPDLLGPEMARALGIPYVAAEASYARKRDHSDWAPWQRPVAEGLRAADAIFCFTDVDREGLLSFGLDQKVLIAFPPFLSDVPAAVAEDRGRLSGDVRLVAVAMMRPGSKLASYRDLAGALTAMPDLPWRLTIVGDGPERPAVERLFAPVISRVSFVGECTPVEVAAHLTAADLFVWPGHGEAYGLAYLEAAAHGLPVVAYATGGVPAIVTSEQTGLLVPAGDTAALTAATARLVRDPEARRALGTAARRLVVEERSLVAASRQLDHVLRGLGARPQR